MTNPKLDYYYFNACPFCKMVMREIKSNNILVNYCDIWGDPKFSEKLIQDRGKRTVPVLYIDGIPMGESSDIMDWLDKNKDNLEKEQK
ncbi:MAG: glutathione S-transferase N-terminal domain-containing protein [Bacteriovoracaceae bacterium]|nr:glutathione S-transferase N-terminal domain-containing protein [Bacteriovoracaceae bacterium]